MECAFQNEGIPEMVSLMAKKPSRFGGGGTYTTMKQRIIDKLKAFYEKFAGMGA